MNKIINIENLSKTYKVRERNDAFLLKRIFQKKKYREVQALKDVTLNIKTGEFVGLIGNNGAGKSTLIKLMTGILYRTHGKIEIMGRDPFKHRQKNNQEIGVVFGQRTQLNWDLSTLDSLHLLKTIYDIDDTVFKSNIQLFTDIFGMQKTIKQPVRTLSLGQRMQCELMAAFLHNPKLVFLDEPTVGLDIFSKEAIVKFLIEMKEKRKTTLILTTHDLEEISKVCDRAIVIHEGNILFEEKIQTLLSIHNQHKKVIFTTENEFVEPIDLSKKFAVTYQPFKIIFEKVRKNEIHELIVKVTNHCYVKDISIEGSNFTAIIKEYLRGDR